MPRILFPASSAPGKDEVEGSGRLINAYSEKLQDGAPAQYVIRRAPGLASFGEPGEAGAVRGLWYDGEARLYATIGDDLIYFDADGVATTVGTLSGAQITFVDSFSNTATQTTYTFASVDIGSEHFNRHVIVAVFFAVANDYPPDEVTVGGVTATLVVASGSQVALYIALVPTGTTADVVVTYATSATGSIVGVWRADGLASSTAVDTDSASGSASFLSLSVDAPSGSVVLSASVVPGALGTAPSVGGSSDGTFLKSISEGTLSGAWKAIVSAGAIGTTVPNPLAIDTVYAVSATWAAAASGDVTFAKNNKAPTPDQVLCTPVFGAYTFTSSALTILDVNSDLPNSVCYGDGFFFFTTPGGLCYASGLNATTVNSLDVIRAEARAEELVRGVFWSGELYLFAQTHTEVWASNGNPNASGFPLNRTTVIWRGLVGTLAVCGFEEGFEGGLFFVADDNSVRLLSGYQPQTISTPDVERAIEACANKPAIRCFVYDLDGHACVVVDLAGEATWVYDLTEGGRWHERKSDDADAWRLTGNSVRAFGKWIAGDRTSGNLYQIDPSTYDEDGDPLSFVAESIAMEAFPQRLQVPRADFNFGMGVGTDDVEDPKVKIQWSDDGGHTWSDPLTASLGEKGRRKMQVRKNRLGLTGVKGRRFRLTVDDPVYVALLAGSMEVEARR